LNPKRILLVLVLAGTGLLVGTFALIDTLAREAIEAGGTHALGVPTTLESAHIGVTSGMFGLQGLVVSNPEGFEGEHIVTLEQGELALALPTLLKDTVRAPKLELTGISMLIQKGAGGFNYEVLLDNLEKIRDDGGGAPEGEPDIEEPGTAKRFVLDRIVIRDIETSVDLFGEGELTTATLSIPVVVIDDLGGEPKTLSQVMKLVFETLLESSVEFGADLLPGQLTQQIENRLDGAKGELYDKADDALAELSEDLGPEATQALEGLLDQAKGEVDKGLRKGLDELFGKKKKD